MSWSTRLRVLVRTALVFAVVLAASALSPAQAASRPALTISPTAPIRAEAFTVTTTFPTRLRRPVQLQRLSGRTWVRVKRGVTSSRGLARFSHRTSASRQQLRIWAPRFRAKGRTYVARYSRARMVTTVGQSVALSVSRAAADQVDARITASQARSGRRVSLQTQVPGGVWRTAASKRMGSSRTTTFADVMAVSSARGLRMRAYLSSFGGAPAITSALHLPPRVELGTTQGEDEIRFSATTSGAVRKVRFFVDGRLLAEDVRAPFEATWPARPGTHDVLARAVGPLESAVTSPEQVRTPEATVGADTGVAQGWSLEGVQSGFELPTSAAVTSTGLVFVSEKSGVVKTISPDSEGGWSTPDTVLDLRELVFDSGDSGLIGIAVDPDFADNGFVYVSYVLDDGGSGDELDRAQQVARFTWNGVELDATSRHIVLGSITGPACHAIENIRTPDCVPLIGSAHTIGDLGFDASGHLLVGVGDGALYVAANGLAGRLQTLRAQDPEILAGKILRIDPATGRGVAGNPMYTGDGSSNSSRVLAMGLRNPFRFTVMEDRLVLGDVGESSFEELNVVSLSSERDTPVNFGWPCVEGTTVTSLPGFEQEDSPWHTCVGVRAEGVAEAPAHAYPHSGGGSVTAGAFLDSPSYPPGSRGRYLFGDYAQNFMRTAELSSGSEISGSSPLADSTAADGPVKFFTGPDGLVWVLSIYSGSIRRVRYTGEGWNDRCALGSFRRTFHDLDGPDSVFDRDYPADEWRWLYPYVIAELPATAFATPTCEPDIRLEPSTTSPWATPEEPDDRAHPGDRFGTAWRGRVEFEAGTYRFTVRGSEWVRLWVDNRQVHNFYSNDFWNLESTRQHDVVLSAGQHTIRAEHVHGDQASAFTDVRWERIGGPPEVEVTAPSNGWVASAGQVPWSVEVSDPGGDSQSDLASHARLEADFLHYSEGAYHQHPVARVNGLLSGVVAVDGAHAPGSGVIRLRATATDASGASTTSAPVYVCLPDSPVGPCGD